MIAIIIPFFQRRRGLLEKALRSVLNQRTKTPWRLILVDDGSPINAEEELAALRPALGERLTFIKQSNAGVSAARNRALDALPATTQIVAFLDSDDVWEAGHLDRIRTAWEAGADFYFEDSQRHDAPHSWFREIGLDPGRHIPLAAAHELYWFQGDFFDALLRRSPAMPSSLAYKFSAVPGLRFPLGQSPGEDTYFCLQASRHLRKVAFSSVNGVAMGAGVNVSRADWGTLAEVKRLFGETRYRHLLNALPLTDEQRELNRMAIKGVNVDFWRAALATACRREYRHGALVRSYLALQPSAVVQLPAAVMKTVKAKTARPLPVR